MCVGVCQTEEGVCWGGGGVTGTWVQLHGSVNGKRAGTRAAFNSTLDLKINKPETRMIAMCFVYVICLYGYVFGS